MNETTISSVGVVSWASLREISFDSLRDSKCVARFGTKEGRLEVPVSLDEYFALQSRGFRPSQDRFELHIVRVSPVAPVSVPRAKLWHDE